MESKHRLRVTRAKRVLEMLDALARLRMKAGYKKISEEKRRKLRNRIREVLGWLREALPRMEGIVHPCDYENSWEVIYPSRRELEEKRRMWQSIVMTMMRR